MYKVCVVVVSDKGYTGEEEDYVGKSISDYLKDNEFDISLYTIIPEVKDIVERFLTKCCDEYGVNLVVVIGNSSFLKEDVKDICEDLKDNDGNKIFLARRKNTFLISCNNDIEIKSLDLDKVKELLGSGKLV